MGTDEMAVVDPLTMRVRGVEGLRVVDAAVFPFVTNANILAPVMMTAEEAGGPTSHRASAPLPAEQVRSTATARTPPRRLLRRDAPPEPPRRLFGGDLLVHHRHVDSLPAAHQRDPR